MQGSSPSWVRVHSDHLSSVAGFLYFATTIARLSLPPEVLVVLALVLEAFVEMFLSLVF